MKRFNLFSILFILLFSLNTFAACFSPSNGTLTYEIESFSFVSRNVSIKNSIIRFR